MKSGYLIGVDNPNFSGIATLTFCSEKPVINPPKAGVPKFAPRGRVERVYTDAGYGVRQLAAALGRHFERAGPHTRIQYTVDELGMLEYFVVGEDEDNDDDPGSGAEDVMDVSIDPELLGENVR